MKKLLSTLLIMSMILSLNSISASSDNGATTVFSGDHLETSVLQYNVTPISKIKVTNMNQVLLSETEKNSADDMASSLANLTPNEPVTVASVEIENNTANGFIVQLEPGTGQFAVVTTGSEDYGTHGEEGIDYNLSFDYGAIPNDANITITDTGFQADSQPVHVIFDASDLKSKVQVNATILLDITSAKRELFKMAGAYKESFTLRYIDKFGSDGNGGAF